MSSLVGLHGKSVFTFFTFQTLGCWCICWHYPKVVHPSIYTSIVWSEKTILTSSSYFKLGLARGWWGGADFVAKLKWHLYFHQKQLQVEIWNTFSMWDSIWRHLQPPLHHHWEIKFVCAPILLITKSVQKKLWNHSDSLKTTKFSFWNGDNH